MKARATNRCTKYALLSNITFRYPSRRSEPHHTIPRAPVMRPNELTRRTAKLPWERKSNKRNCNWNAKEAPKPGYGETMTRARAGCICTKHDYRRLIDELEAQCSIQSTQRHSINNFNKKCFHRLCQDDTRKRHVQNKRSWEKYAEPYIPRE